MEIKTLKGITLASTAGICWGSMGVAAQYLMAECRFTVLDLTSIRLLGAGILLVLLDIFWNRTKLSLRRKISKTLLSMVLRFFAHNRLFSYLFSAPMRQQPPLWCSPLHYLSSLIWPLFITDELRCWKWLACC